LKATWPIPESVREWATSSGREGREAPRGYLTAGYSASFGVLFTPGIVAPPAPSPRQTVRTAADRFGALT
jgi:hypothetical protein